MGEYTKRRFGPKRFVAPNGEVLSIRGHATGDCRVHAWPTDGLALRLIQAMRDYHPKGIKACRGCITRAIQDRERARLRARNPNF